MLESSYWQKDRLGDYTLTGPKSTTKIPPALWATGGLEAPQSRIHQSPLPSFPGEGFTPPLTPPWKLPLSQMSYA